MKLIIPVFLLFATICFSQDYWESTNGPLGSMFVHSIASNSDEEIFISGEDGIYRCSPNFEYLTKIWKGHYETIAINSLDMIFAINDSSIIGSSDNGVSWIEKNNDLKLKEIESIAIDSDNNVFIADFSRGVFRSGDNGESWIECNTGIVLHNTNIIHIDTTNNIIYVGVNNEYIYDNADSNVVLYSSDNKGDSWTKIYGLEGRGEITSIATTSKGDVYLTLEHSVDWSYSGELYKSNDNGENWIKIMNNGNKWETTEVSINSQGDIFVADIRQWHESTNPGIFRSIDNGESWTKILSLGENWRMNTIYIESENELFVNSSCGFFHSIDNGDSWTKKLKNVSPVNVDGAFITAEDEIIIWTSYGDGIFISSDKGENWNQCSEGLPNDVDVSCILETSNGDIFVGLDGAEGVYLFKEKGNTWIEMNNGLPKPHCIKFLLENTNGDIIIGLEVLSSINLSDIGSIYVSSDNGNNWIKKSNGLPYFSYTNNGIVFYECRDVSSGIITNAGDILIADENEIYYSSDNCESWVKRSSIPPHPNDISSMIVNSKGDIFAICRSGVYRSSDNGRSWIGKNNGLLNNIDDYGENIVCMINPSDETLYVGTDHYGIFYSTDNGDNWKSINNGLPKDSNFVDGIESINNLSYDSEGHIYAVIGWDCVIYKSIEPLPVGINNEKIFDKLPSNYSLSQNYPNPFNPNTTIKYSIPRQSKVTLKVFDMLGREVARLVNKVQPQGNYELEFNASELVSGIYFYRIQAGDFVETKKMILLR